jgi:serine/threonine protein kinase
LKWALHAAEAFAYIHTKRVIHCDIGPGNLLLDRDLNVRVSDFQGRLLYPNGTIRLNGDSAEGVKSSMPRSDPNDADQKTDIFALGSAIYFIIKGHLPFPELDS